jgi:hypothetical protein
MLAGGTGKLHSDGGKTPKPLSIITLDAIQAMLTTPHAVDKDNALWAIFSNVHTRSLARQKENGNHYALWADLDLCEGLTFEGIKDAVQRAVGSDIWVYSSRSATLENPKCRVIVPLLEPVAGKDYSRIQQVLNDRIQAAGIEPDPKNLTANQICFLPNRGEYYEQYSTDFVGSLDPTEWQDDLAKLVLTEQAARAALDAKREQAKLKVTERMQSDQLSPVDAFKRHYPLTLMLESCGYLQRGDRWLSPNSESGVAGVKISDDGLKWFSQHGSDIGIGQTTNGTAWGDVFDLFVHYNYGGNYNAAVKAAGEMFTNEQGVSITKQNQINHMANKPNADVIIDIPALPSQHNDIADVEGFDLSKFSLRGSSKEMQSQMLDDKFILGRMALLGQSTVFYAKPNAGKTLLTLWLLIEAIKSGEIKGSDVFYVNADDNFKGLTYKLELAERWGFEMLAPSYNGFDTAQLAVYLHSLVLEDKARGKILILDTMKKFMDIMDKRKGTEFGKQIRAFVSHGGSMVMLAHVNKHRDADKKLQYSGTSDVVDDCDCAYMLDEIAVTTDGMKTVKFENIKSRGDVASTATYRYDAADGTIYKARLESVISVSDEQVKSLEQSKAIDAMCAKHAESRAALLDVMKGGLSVQTEIIKAAHERSGLSTNKLLKALKDHTGENHTQGKYWSVTIGDKNTHTYKVNWPYGLMIGTAENSMGAHN